FIKSLRGSDVDAALHYLARMITAGEDPRFIARRLMISASEDVGLADPQILPATVAAAQAVALIGLPEARIILAQAVIQVALAPKSNAAYLAIDEALADVRAGLASGATGQVPPHLRDAHYPGARALGHGAGYRYPHDESPPVAAQQYLPDAARERRYYSPTESGAERAAGERWRKIRGLLRGAPGGGCGTCHAGRGRGAVPTARAEPEFLSPGPGPGFGNCRAGLSFGGLRSRSGTDGGDTPARCRAARRAGPFVR
ncbi:MAG: hypothetical protein ACRC0L_09390, partial [Angustibacter sp.]